MARVGDLEATDTGDSTLNYGIVVDCGSSGSRVFVYFWPPHNGNPHDLLDIKQMRDQSSQPVVKKIKPGLWLLLPYTRSGEVWGLMLAFFPVLRGEGQCW